MSTFANAIEKLLKDNKEIFLTGVEREGLRMTKEGILASTPHPKAFGIKLENYHIKTDFCESQPEIVTSPCGTVEETYEVLGRLTTELQDEIAKRDELFWAQSMPCILPEEEEIETANHPGDFAKPLRDYLSCVRELYGAKIQTICGIHFNVSIKDEFFERLMHATSSEQSLQNFKNNAYLKILRNYTRYHWFILLITGASPVFHESFGYHLDSLSKSGELWIGQHATSLRMSRIGYQNKKRVCIDYTTLDAFTDSIVHEVKLGNLIDEGGLFAPIKMKARDNVNYVSSLHNQGILYVELRDIDLNPFDPYALSVNDMKFLELFLLYMLCAEEDHFPDWQQEAQDIAYLVAERGGNQDIQVYKSGEKVMLREMVEEFCEQLACFNEKLAFMDVEVLQDCLERARYYQKSYAGRILDRVYKRGYIKGNLFE